MTYDGSNRKQVRQAEKAAALADANRIAFTRTIMSDIFGRAWMHSLLSRCNVFHTPFVAGAPDHTSFNCGSQNIGLAIFADVVVHCPAEYVLMMHEANVKDQANDRRNSDDRTPAGEPAGREDTGRDVEGSGDYDPYARTEEA